MDDKIIYGTTLKYLLEIQADGFDMTDDDFDVKLACQATGKTITLSKSDLVYDGDGDNWYVIFDSREIGPGIVDATVTAHVPDSDCPGGMRDEIAVIRRIARIVM